jgi:hypothetical protein
VFRLVPGDDRAKVADVDRRLAQIDQAVEEASRRGRTKTALTAMESERKARASLASEREEAGRTKEWPKKTSGTTDHRSWDAQINAGMRFVPGLWGTPRLSR